MTKQLLSLLVCALATQVHADDSGRWNDRSLTATAERALHGFMVNNPTRIPGPERMYRFHFGSMGLPIPWIQPAQWDLGDCTGRAVQQWIQVRAMTGEHSFGKEIEEGQRKLLLSLLDPETGLVTVPEMKDAKIGAPYFQMWDQGRTMRALVDWYIAEPDAAQKRKLQAAVQKMIAGAEKIGTHGVDLKYGPYTVYRGDAFRGEQKIDDVKIMRGGQLLEPLAVYWKHSKDPAALSLAKRICAGARSGHESDGYTGWLAGTLRFGADGSFTGHYHDHVSIALGVARLGAALYEDGQKDEGLENLRWARMVYDWMLSPENPNVGGSIGWFPENNGENTGARQISETCSLADAIEFAAALAETASLDPSLAANDALWDHVERYSVNTLVNTQFQVTPKYVELIKDFVAEKMVGNGLVSLTLEAQGTFDHQRVGHQTLVDSRGGHLSQMIHGLSYDGGEAHFGYGDGGKPHGFRVTKPAERKDNAFAGEVATTDGKLTLAHTTAPGKGPYAVRTFVVRNVSAAPVKAIRFSVAANLDHVNFNSETGAADAEKGRVIITADDSGVLALGGLPKPSAVRAGDAVDLLNRYMRLDWKAPAAHAQGNVGAAAMWEVGELAPGEEKTIEVILAAVDSPEDVDRAVSGGTFESWERLPNKTSTAAPEAFVKTAKRQEGGWIACGYPDDMVYHGGDGNPTMHWMGCCHYAGVRGLYGAWRPIFDERGDELLINLPIDRKGILADQRLIEQGDQVEREIDLHQSCAVMVRVPDWVDISKVKVARVMRAAAPVVVRPTIEGRWLRLDRQIAGAKVIVSYPLTERTTKERFGGDNKGDAYARPAEKIQYTIQWRGNRVKMISPRGERMPIFSDAAR